MKTHFFKRGIAGLLSLVMCLSAFIGLGTTTAFAAGEQAEVYLISFPRSGDANLDYSGTWGHSNLHYMNGWYSGESKYTTIRAMHSYDGNICYCIEPGTPQDTGDRYTSKDETFWDNLPSDFNSTISPYDMKLFIGRIIRSDVKSITVNEMFDLWCQLKRGIKDSTFKNYIYMYELFVKPSFGKNRLVQVKKSDVRKFYNSLADGKVLKIATIDNVHNVLHQVFQVAVDDGMIRQNPTDNMLKELKLSHGFEREKKEALTVAQQKLFFDYMLISAVHHENGEERLHLLMLDPHIPAGAKMY